MGPGRFLKSALIFEHFCRCFKSPAHFKTKIDAIRILVHSRYLPDVITVGRALFQQSVTDCCIDISQPRRRYRRR